ncbi:MAG: molybdenum ABC transporter ATP-binding protein [Pseudomonadota bacterium]
MLRLEAQQTFGPFRMDVEISAPRGTTALFGRSGSGKTTLVNIVAGLLRPDVGRVVLDDTVLTDTQRGIFCSPHKRRLGYVFQDARLFPHLSVRKNLLYGQRYAPPDAKPLDLMQITELLDIGDLLDRRPAGLSGGERQRVAIGRAILSAPRMLLMDEPLASLDNDRKSELLPFLERLRDNSDVPILYVSHSLAEIARLATTIAVIDNGHVSFSGPAAQVLSNPRAVHALGVRETGSILPATVVAHHPTDRLTELATSAGPVFLPQVTHAPGTVLQLRIAARDIILSKTRPTDISALNVLPATITEIHPGAGPGAAVGLMVGKSRIVARITRRSVAQMALEPGQSVYAVLKSTALAAGDEIQAPPALSL